MVIYLGRCPRLYVAALSARGGYTRVPEAIVFYFFTPLLFAFIAFSARVAYAGPAEAPATAPNLSD